MKALLRIAKNNKVHQLLLIGFIVYLILEMYYKKNPIYLVLPLYIAWQVSSTDLTQFNYKFESTLNSLMLVTGIILVDYSLHLDHILKSYTMIIFVVVVFFITDYFDIVSSRLLSMKVLILTLAQYFAIGSNIFVIILLCVGIIASYSVVFIYFFVIMTFKKTIKSESSAVNSILRLTTKQLIRCETIDFALLKKTITTYENYLDFLFRRQEKKQLQTFYYAVKLLSKEGKVLNISKSNREQLEILLSESFELQHNILNDATAHFSNSLLEDVIKVLEVFNNRHLNDTRKHEILI